MSGERLDVILAALDDAYDGDGWHGPSLRGSLRRVTAAEAIWRPAPGQPTVWELVVHCAYWKYVVWRRLTGAKRGSFARTGSDFPACGPDLAADLQLLDETHGALRAAIAQCDPATLPLPAGGTGQVTVRKLTLGAAAHDAYHAGQLQLLRRLYRERNR